MEATLTALKITRNEVIPAKDKLIDWRESHAGNYQARYSSHLTDETGAWAKIAEVKPDYEQNAPEINAFELLNQYFDGLLNRDPRVIAFGEDVGYLGGVNQTMAGLQAKHGELRVSDTGIHEIAIMGRAIGMAMRGLRPIAEIQYLDYLLYALQIMSDDLASLRWRTYGGQQAPVIVRTRGHRLEGIWHSGSPMGSIIHLLRGMHVLVPRDATRAAGFYNALTQQNDPALIVEVLNGYRKKERLPNNLDRLTVPIGIPEVLREGDDVTLVTYGALCHIALDAAEELHDLGIEVEVIDVQSLLPFDIHHQIVKSLKKTNRIVCVDEDVPGATTAYMLQEILETQGGYHWLDAEPRTLTAKPHRPAYGTDGNYFSKPNKEDIFMTVYALMHESNPAQHPNFWKLSRNDEFGGGAE